MSDDTPEQEDPMLKQVGGSHYMYMKIQPAEFINKNKLLFAEGNAIKYICRHSSKGGIQDIDKAIHYLEMVKERDYKREEPKCRCLHPKLNGLHHMN